MSLTLGLEAATRPILMKTNSIVQTLYRVCQSQKRESFVRRIYISDLKQNQNKHRVLFSWEILQKLFIALKLSCSKANFLSITFTTTVFASFSIQPFAIFFQRFACGSAARNGNDKV